MEGAPGNKSFQTLVFVTVCDENVCDEELKSCFQQYGQIRSYCRLANRPEKTACVVDYVQLEDAANAINDMNGAKLRGINVQCHFGFPSILVNNKIKRTSPKRTSKPNHLPCNEQGDDAKLVENVVNVPKSPAATPLAAASLTGTSETPVRPPVTPNRSATLLVKNTGSTPEDELKSFFLTYGEIKFVLSGPSYGFALVCFTAIETMENAKKAINGSQTMLPNCSIPLVIESMPPKRLLNPPSAGFSLSSAMNEVQRLKKLDSAANEKIASDSDEKGERDVVSEAGMLAILRVVGEVRMAEFERMMDLPLNPEDKRCYFFSRGLCRNGADCPFFHDPTPIDKREKKLRKKAAQAYKNLLRQQELDKQFLENGGANNTNNSNNSNSQRERQNAGKKHHYVRRHYHHQHAPAQFYYSPMHFQQPSQHHPVSFPRQPARLYQQQHALQLQQYSQSSLEEHYRLIERHMRGPCPSFQTNGLCTLGDTCMYLHGEQLISMPQLLTEEQVAQMQPGQSVSHLNPAWVRRQQQREHQRGYASNESPSSYNNDGRESDESDSDSYDETEIEQRGDEDNSEEGMDPDEPSALSQADESEEIEGMQEDAPTVSSIAQSVVPNAIAANMMVVNSSNNHNNGGGGRFERRSTGPARRRRRETPDSAQQHASKSNFRNGSNFGHRHSQTNHNGQFYHPYDHRRQRVQPYDPQNAHYAYPPPPYYYVKPGAEHYQPHVKHAAPNPSVPMAPPGYYIMPNHPTALHQARQHYYAQQNPGLPPQFYPPMPVPFLIPPSPHSQPLFYASPSDWSHVVSSNQLMLAQNQQQLQHFQQQQMSLQRAIDSESNSPHSNTPHSHSPTNGQQQRQSNSPQSQHHHNTTSVSCFYYRTGYCWKGASCAFSHDEPEENVRSKTEEKDSPDKCDSPVREKALDDHRPTAGARLHSGASHSSAETSDEDSCSSTSASLASSCYGEPSGTDYSSLMAKNELIEHKVNDLEREKSDLEARLRAVVKVSPNRTQPLNPSLPQPANRQPQQSLNSPRPKPEVLPSQGKRHEPLKSARASTNISNSGSHSAPNSTPTSSPEHDRHVPHVRRASLERRVDHPNCS